MRREILALTCMAATLAAGASWAQNNAAGFGEGGSCKKSPPGSGEQLCIDDGTPASVGHTARGAARLNADQSSVAATAAPAPTATYNDSSATTASSTGSTWSSDQSAATPEPAAASATVTTELVASAPVPDTPANRARYGQPMSHAGKLTAARGN